MPKLFLNSAKSLCQAEKQFLALWPGVITLIYPKSRLESDQITYNLKKLCY